MIKEIPDFLVPYTKTQCLQRLLKIDMNCGVNYTSLPFFRTVSSYSRYEHSLNTALLAYHFTEDPRQALACLFHDCSTPAFSHTVDFLHHDFVKQEYTEGKIEMFIRQDTEVMELLKKDGIKVNEVSDYHIYPICDNSSPQLSCDRLEYTLSNALYYGFCNPKNIVDIVDDIEISQNEYGEEELFFHSVMKANEFCELSLKCGTIYASCMDRYAMQRLSEILREAMSSEVLQESDLYMDEPYVIGKLLQSSLREAWLNYTKLSSIQLFSSEVEGSLQLRTKKRYVNPGVTGKGRCTDLNDSLRKKVQIYVSDKQNEWIKGDTI